MKKILAILIKSYPLEERKPAQLKLAFIFGIIVFLVLFILRPFGTTTNLTTIVLNCAIAALITFVTIVFDFFVFFSIFPLYFKEEKWTIGREIIWTLLIILTIATANMLAGVIFWNGKFSLNGWLRMIFYTAIIGIAPATISILINQARLLNKYRKEAGEINEQLPSKPSSIIIEEEKNSTPNELIEINNDVLQEKNTLELITFKAENEKDSLTILATNFLAATSADNYVKIFYEDGGKLKTTILRSTLKKVEENTALFRHFFRCHRTAIVNMDAIQNVSGNAQGYRLQLTSLTEEIPVSRNLNSVIKEKLAAIRP